MDVETLCLPKMGRNEDAVDSVTRCESFIWNGTILENCCCFIHLLPRQQPVAEKIVLHSGSLHLHLPCAKVLATLEAVLRKRDTKSHNHHSYNSCTTSYSSLPSSHYILTELYQSVYFSIPAAIASLLRLVLNHACQSSIASIPIAITPQAPREIGTATSRPPISSSKQRTSRLTRLP